MAPTVKQTIVIQYPQKQFSDVVESDLYRSGWVECWLTYGHWNGKEGEASTRNLLDQTGPTFIAGNADELLIREAGFCDCRAELLKLRNKFSPQQFQQLAFEVEKGGIPMSFDEE